MPRTPEEPTPEKVYMAMNAGEPYTVRELAEEFDDTSRWTIQRRLDMLVEEGFVQRKQHSEKRVSYWISE